MNTDTHHSILVGLGNAVRRHRVMRGFSQEALAEMVGLHRTYIGSVERGERNVSLLNLAKIANAFDLSVSKLLNDVEQEVEELTNEFSKQPK